MKGSVLDIIKWRGLLNIQVGMLEYLDTCTSARILVQIQGSETREL